MLLTPITIGFTYIFGKELAVFGLTLIAGIIQTHLIKSFSHKQEELPLFSIKAKVRYSNAEGEIIWHTPDEKLPGWDRLPGNQGIQDPEGNRWKEDHKHKDTGRTSRPCAHWDISDKNGKKVAEVDKSGRQIWPNGAKNKNKK